MNILTFENFIPRTLLLTTLLFIISCVHKQPANIALFDYQDFGPQSAAHKLLGIHTWSWQKNTCCEQQQSPPITIVVYRYATLTQAQKAYPID